MINPKETKKEFLLELLNKDIHKVLDLGCGEMLLSKPFLEKGAFVKGIDMKEPSKIPKGAVFVKGNILQEDFNLLYDLIISSLILHLFKKQHINKIISKMKDSTSKHGYNFLILLSNKDSLSSSERQEKFFPSLEEISQFYTGWKTIKVLQDETQAEQHGNLPQHTHNLIFVIFQKK